MILHYDDKESYLGKKERKKEEFMFLVSFVAKKKKKNQDRVYFSKDLKYSNFFALAS